MKVEDDVIIGIRGHLVSIDSSTGAERWRQKLKGSSFCTVNRHGQHVHAGARGELFCVDAATGSIVWHNDLPGLGFGLISFAADPARSLRNLIIGVKGHAVAIEPSTGHELWRSKLNGRMVSDLVTLRLLGDERIVAGHSGELTCLDRRTGVILWGSPLKRLGMDVIDFGGDEHAVIQSVRRKRQAAAAAAASG